MKYFKLVACMAATLATPKFLQQEYTLETVVIRVEEPDLIHTDGRIKCKADNGRVVFIDGSEDWIEGDIAEITFNDNGTPETYEDDYVVDVKYTGWIY